MARIKTKHAYELQFRRAIEKRHGEYDEILYGLAVSKAASDFHILDLYDKQLEASEEWVTLSSGSTGQLKQEINPLLAQRDKASRTCADALEALQLTPRSIWKKQEGRIKEENDPMLEFLNATKI